MVMRVYFMDQKGLGTLGYSKQCMIQQLPGKAVDAQGEWAHPCMQRVQDGSWSTASQEGVKVEDLSLLEKGRHRGWTRNKDQMKYGFEKHTLLLKLVWGGTPDLSLLTPQYLVLCHLPNYL